MNLLPRAIQPEATVVIMHRAPRREVMRQLSPRTTCAVRIQNRIDHLAQIDCARAFARLGRRYRRRDQFPLLVRHVRWVSGLIDELGGCNLDAGIGVDPEWVLVATVAMVAQEDCAGTSTTIELQEAETTSTVRAAEGPPYTFDVPPEQIIYGFADLNIVECDDATDCDDGLWCNGAETCDPVNDCQAGSNPCTDNEWCDEDGDACIPFGDGHFDSDDDVDLRDSAMFHVCFGQLALDGCEPGNLTGDGVIDLDDFALFVQVLNGPQ